jgi:TonB family protein
MFRFVLAVAIAAIAIPAFINAPAYAESDACKVHAIADAPQIARDSGVTGEALVAVNLNDNGRVDKATIAYSSGNRWLDEAALRAAYDARFTGDCQDGILIVDFK